MNFMIDNIKQISHNILSDNFREDIQWQHLRDQSLNVFNVVEILRFHHQGCRMQNIVIQNANINIGSGSISRVARLSEIVNFAIKSFKLLNHRIMNFVQRNVRERLKEKLNPVSVLIAENLLRLKGLLQIFAVLGNAELHDKIHQIGQHGQKNLKNVNNAEKNSGLNKIKYESVKVNSVLKNVSQNLNKFTMLLHQNSTIWQNGKRFVLKFLNVMIINVRLVVLMARDFISTILNTNVMEEMRT